MDHSPIHNFTFNISYSEINRFDYWVHPDAGGISIGLSHQDGYKVEIVISSRDLDDYFPEDPELLIPGRIYINNNMIELNSPEQEWVMTILKKMLINQKLGHPKGLGVYTVDEVISFFTSQDALIFREKLMGK
ncbi:hypothetical protein V6R21_00390 [Limibacter armeniacum]|uniref:hypothetical protein n=1 Tax=Limibacter armeniacum TaxID=466084 RepID=UPI002FE62EA4